MTVYTSDSGGDYKVGNKEYYSNVIKDISPMKTPVFNIIGEEMVDATSVEFYTEDLRATDTSDDQAVAQGGTPDEEDEDRILMNNRTQIFARTAKVSDTQEVQKKVGIKSELNHRGERVLVALKQDYELSCMVRLRYRSPKTSATASLMQGMTGQIALNSTLANSGTSYGGDNTVNVNILNENLDNSSSLAAQSRFLTAHEGVYTLGSEADTFIMSPLNARYMSAWDSSGVTRNIGDPRKLIDNVEFYESPFGLVKRMIHRRLAAYSDNGTDSYDGVTGAAVTDFAYLITPSLWKRLTLQGYGWQSEELGRTGPLTHSRSYKFQGSLKCINPGGELLYCFAQWATHAHTLSLPTTAGGYIQS